MGSGERMASMLESLELSPFRKELLRQRWLDQVAWAGTQARRMRRRYYATRIPVVIGGVAIPGLVTLSLTAAETGDLPGFRAVTFAISLGVAGLTALEGFFQYGDRWRHYRRTAERLKSVGWQYLMLNGPFRQMESHEAGFVSFTEKVEQILNEDVEGYLDQILGSQGPDGSNAGPMD